MVGDIATIFGILLFLIGIVLSFLLVLAIFAPIPLTIGWANVISLYLKEQTHIRVSAFKRWLVCIAILALMVMFSLLSKTDPVFSPIWSPLWFCIGLLGFISLLLFPVSTMRQCMLFGVVNLLSVVMLGAVYLGQIPRPERWSEGSIFLFSGPLNILINGAFAIVSYQQLSPYRKRGRWAIMKTMLKAILAGLLWGGVVFIVSLSGLSGSD